MLEARVAPVRGNTQAAYPPSLCVGLPLEGQAVQVQVGALGRAFLRKLCSQQSLGSLVSLAFLASFKSCFLLKGKKKEVQVLKDP